jgi:hypothetical protein
MMIGKKKYQVPVLNCTRECGVWIIGTVCGKIKRIKMGERGWWGGK